MAAGSAACWGVAGWLFRAWYGPAGGGGWSARRWSAELGGVLAFALSHGVGYLWLRGRDLRTGSRPTLPVPVSYAWRIGFILLLYAPAILPAVVVAAAVSGDTDDDGGRFDALAGWVSVHLVLAAAGGIAAMLVGGLVPIWVLAVRSAVRYRGLRHRGDPAATAAGNRALAFGLMAVGVLIVLVAGGLAAVSTVLVPGVLAGSLALAFALLLAGAVCLGAWLGLVSGARPWDGPAMPRARPLTLRRGWPLLAVRLAAALVLLALVAGQVREAYTGGRW